MSNELPFGIDVSRYDGLLDWDKVRTHVPKIEFMALRATISWGYIDPFFSANWRACRQYGIPRMAYHVVYPAEIPERQYDNLMKAVKEDWSENDRMVLDVELEFGAHDVSVSRYTACVRRMADKIAGATGHMPILYSRAEFINRRLDFEYLDNLDLWLAQYLGVVGKEHPGPPTLPKGASDWLIHQTGDKLPNICATSGKQYQDYNRWNGVSMDILRYFGLQSDTLTFEERLLALEFRVSDLERRLNEIQG